MLIEAEIRMASQVRMCSLKSVLSSLFIFTITEGSLLILLDLWFRGFIKSLCLAAELSKQVENSGGVSKSAAGEMLLSDVWGDIVLALACLGNSWPSVEWGLEEGPDVT